MRIFRRIPLRIIIFLTIFPVIIALLSFYIVQMPKSSLNTTISDKIVIDYTAVTRKLDPIAIGMDISGYGYPYVFANDPTEQEKIKTLGIKYMRMDLMYST